VAANNGRAVVEVSDTGPGIDPAVRARIFEPFFSTKTSGSGLGLALVKKIVEDHGGGVELASAPGEGTRVTLWLPCDDPRPSA
jgi:signal transduction histidine kinase